MDEELKNNTIRVMYTIGMSGKVELPFRDLMENLRPVIVVAPNTHQDIVLGMLEAGANHHVFVNMIVAYPAKFVVVPVEVNPGLYASFLDENPDGSPAEFIYWVERKSPREAQEYDYA